MQVTFSPKIELSEWFCNWSMDQEANPSYYKRLISKPIIMASINFDVQKNLYTAKFYRDLSYLNNIVPDLPREAEEAQKIVDDFIIRMSKLRAYI